jgi:hypothetical protein
MHAFNPENVSGIMQMLGKNLFFDTLNAISIKVPVHVFVQSQLHDFTN